MTVPMPSWKDVAAGKQAARDALIPAAWKLSPKDLKSPAEGGLLNVTGVPATCGILTPKELTITETVAPKLIEQMLAKELTSVEVTTAFCKRSAIAQQLTNCLTEIFYESALKAAAALDAKYLETGVPAGALHGLPVSLKDCFNVQGVDTTVGFVAWANDPFTAEKESEMTKIMREVGAILFCKTNVPTAMMIAESYNNVWDYTTNPLNRNLSSGGSSGGESALLAMKGAPLGVGTDIGGSLRIPASMTGIYTLKPSFGRFATYGARSGLPGQEAVRSINGPMASDLASVKLWSKAVVDSEPWTKDPNMIPIPWREVTLEKKLSFGIIMDDGICRPTPPVTRALKQTAEALRAAGHEVIEWTAYNPEQGLSLLGRFFVGDGGVKISSIIAESGEDWPLGLQAYAEAAEKSKSAAPPTVGDLWTLQYERITYAKNALEHWNASKALTSTGRPFDGIISPTTAISACLHHTFAHVAYTCLWNITDQPSLVFPVTTLDASKDTATISDYRNDSEKKTWETYKPDQMTDAPVGLQIIGRRLEDEKVLAMGEVIKEALGLPQ